MTTWILLAITLLALSFYPAEAGPKLDPSGSEEKPTPEELGCKDDEIVRKADPRIPGYECATHPRYRKPLFDCSSDRDCVRACEKHDYPEACKEMTHCDEPPHDAHGHSYGGICNDLMKCRHRGDCEEIGDVQSGSANLDCERRDNDYEKRCYYGGGTVIA